LVTIDPIANISPTSLRSRGGIKWNRYDEDVLGAWVADMDFVVAEPVRAAVQRAVDLSAFGYGALMEREPFYAAAANWIATRHGWRPEISQFSLLTDVVQGINVALQVFTDPGDRVIVQGPIYPPFLNGINEQGRVVADNRMIDVTGRAEFDFDDLRRQAADPRTKLMLLCNPHNPSGRVQRRDELEQVAQIALENDLIVIADEIWMDVTYPGHPHIPFQSIAPEIAARTVTLTSATKSFSVAGLPIAVAIAGADVFERFNSLPSHMLGVPGALAVSATKAAWESGGPWLDAVLRQLDENRKTVAAFVAERLPSVRHRSPEGTYLAWLDFGACSWNAPAQEVLLERGRVGLNAGVDFGAEPCWARLNFATSPAILNDVLQRIASVVNGG
jgi:cystathionine beta-lyase